MSISHLRAVHAMHWTLTLVHPWVFKQTLLTARVLVFRREHWNSGHPVHAAKHNNKQPKYADEETCNVYMMDPVLVLPRTHTHILDSVMGFDVCD